MIVSAAQSAIGKTYVANTRGPDTFDAPGFVYYCYSRAGVDVGLTPAAQSAAGQTVGLYDLRPGDILCFDTQTGGTGAVNHTGIYLGEGRFADASPATGSVTVHNLSGSYAEQFLFGRHAVD